MARFQTFALSAMIAALVAVPATAIARPATRLVECGAASCLLVSGHRENARSRIDINGHEVAVEGGRNWRARVPVSTVRAWSEPYARSIAVAVEGHPHDVSLPIGLLGHAENLAMLVVRAK